MVFEGKENHEVYEALNSSCKYTWSTQTKISLLLYQPQRIFWFVQAKSGSKNHQNTKKKEQSSMF